MISLADLFHEGLGRALYAERRVYAVLTRFADAAIDDELSTVLRRHILETENHERRIEFVFELIPRRPRARRCAAIDGLVRQADAALARESPACDSALIAVARSIEHYEIASLGTLISWAIMLEEVEAADLLAENLEEDKVIEGVLAELAGRLGGEAMDCGDVATADAAPTALS